MSPFEYYEKSLEYIKRIRTLPTCNIYYTDYVHILVVFITTNSCGSVDGSMK